MDHIINTKYSNLPDPVIYAAKTFILDTFSCALAGSNGPYAELALEAAKTWGQGQDARVWGKRDRLPAPSAAIINAYQIHCLEFDCVHEGGVLHPMSTIMAAAMAEIDSRISKGVKTSGKELILAISVGIDVSCSIALTSRSSMKFFRPAVVGGFGTTATIGKLRQFEKDTLHNAFGLYYGQAGGNIQAHVEGSKMLGLQVGFGARNALVACDLAEHDIDGPKDFLTGKYGYLELMEGQYELEPTWSEWGQIFRLSEVGHKPFPSGRLTHFAIDALNRIMEENIFKIEEIKTVVCKVPPLPLRLVGRPHLKNKGPNYAKLCLKYICAALLIDKTINQKTFLECTIKRTDIADLAKKVTVIPNDNTDLNAFGPQTIQIYMRNGNVYEEIVHHAIGDPLNPLPYERQLEKFWESWHSAANTMPEVQAAKLLTLINDLENLDDTSLLINAMCP